MIKVRVLGRLRGSEPEYKEYKIHTCSNLTLNVRVAIVGVVVVVLLKIQHADVIEALLRLLVVDLKL